MKNTLLEKEYHISFKATDVIYCGLCIAAFILLYILFYRQAAPFDEGYYYLTDTEVYAKHAKQGEVDPRAISLIFYLLYHINGNEAEIAFFMAAVIIGIIIANYMLIRRLLWPVTVERYIIQAASLLALFSSPIYIPKLSPYFYMNVWSKFAWHNPTQQLMTLFAIISFILFLSIYENYFREISPARWMALSVSFLISAYAKPSFIMTFFPIMAIILVKDFIVRRDVSIGIRFKKIVIFGMSMAPAFIYFLLLNNIIYGSSDSDNQVIISFGYFFNQLDHKVFIVLASLALPILILIFNYRTALKDVPFTAAWGTFAFGLMEYLLLMEDGPRMTDGNFRWGLMVGTYLVFIVSVAKLIHNYREEQFMCGYSKGRKAYFIIAAVLLAGHVLTQVVYLGALELGYLYYV